MYPFLTVWRFAGLVLLWWLLSWVLGLFGISMRVGFVEGVALLLVLFALWRIGEIETKLRDQGDDLEKKLMDIEGRIDRLESD